MDDQWLTPRLLRNLTLDKLPLGPSDAGSLEVCAASSTVGVATNNFWTCITPDNNGEDVKELEVVAAVSKIFAKQKKKREKMKRRAKQAARDKEQCRTDITIKDIIKECSKATEAGGENTEATSGDKSDDDMGDKASGSGTRKSGSGKDGDDKNTPMDGFANDGDNDDDKNRDGNDDDKGSKKDKDDDKEDDNDEEDVDKDDKEKEKAFDIEMKALDRL